MHDHRKLGRELELFDSDPLIGAGLPYWLPAGAAIGHALEEFIREAERRDGYQHVYSPILGKRELYEMSGHWAHYRQDMFPPLDLGSEQLLLRPSRSSCQRWHRPSRTTAEPQSRRSHRRWIG